MPPAFFFSKHILVIVFVRFDFYRNIFNYFQSLGMQANPLNRVVCHKPHFFYTYFA